MKPIENNKQTFTKLNDSLRRISVQKINSTQKIFFAYILGWQEKGKTLTATNKYIANQLGLTESGLRKAIRTSNQKFDFFSSEQDDAKKAEEGNFTSTHEIKIDFDKFNEYLKLNYSKTAFYENLNEPENEPDELEKNTPIETNNNKENENPKQEINKIQFDKIDSSNFGVIDFHELTNDIFSHIPMSILWPKMLQIRRKDKDENGHLYTIKRLFDELSTENKVEMNL